MTKVKKPFDKDTEQQSKPRKNDRETHGGSTSLPARTATAPPRSRSMAGRARARSLVGIFVVSLFWCAYVGKHHRARPAGMDHHIVLPLVRWLNQRGLPRIVGMLAVHASLGGCLHLPLLRILLSTPVAYWLGRATEIRALIERTTDHDYEHFLLEELQKSLNAIGAGQPCSKWSNSQRAW